MRYSLINVSKTFPDGRINGVWIQHFTGEFEDAVEYARDTERVNSNRITVAVVHELSNCCPDYSLQIRLKRLD